MGLILLLVLGVLLLCVFTSVVIVPQGFEYTVERFGRYTHKLSPGFTLIVPFIDRVGQRINMMEQLLDIPSQEIITKDNAMISVDGIVFFQVLESPKAAYEVANLFSAILNLVTTNLRTVMGAMDLDETLSRRDAINARLMHVVDDATAPWGIKITRVEIKDIRPPADIVNAMARQMKAERDKRAAILEAEGQRASEILRAEGQKQGQILEAEGRREAAFRDAEARERAAAAEAEATRLVSEAIGRGNVQALQYFVAQKYVTAMQAFADSPNSKTIFMPMETSGLLGSLGGVSELLRAVGEHKNG